MTRLYKGEKWKIIVGLIFLGFFSSFNCPSVANATEPPQYIAHAGGAVGLQTYTNSLEALESNYNNGFRFFEIDFSWTADGELAAIHDWEGALKGKYIVPEGMKVPTLAEFLDLKPKTGLTQLSLKHALLWAKNKGDAFIVTDVKDGNVRALREISLGFKGLKQFVIPQVYSYQEYAKVDALGYTQIILTLYRMRIDPYEVIDFSKKNTPFAVTMPWQVASTGLAYYLSKIQTKVYAHTVNDISLFDDLRKLGVFGIYTDSISPQ